MQKKDEGNKRGRAARWAALRVWGMGYFLLVADLGGDCETLAAFCATAREDLAAVGGGHSLTEAMLVYSLAVVGLVSPFHCLSNVKKLNGNGD